METKEKMSSDPLVERWGDKFVRRAVNELNGTWKGHIQMLSLVSDSDRGVPFGEVRNGVEAWINDMGRNVLFHFGQDILGVSEEVLRGTLTDEVMGTTKGHSNHDGYWVMFHRTARMLNEETWDGYNPDFERFWAAYYSNFRPVGDMSGATDMKFLVDSAGEAVYRWMHTMVWTSNVFLLGPYWSFFNRVYWQIPHPK